MASVETDRTDNARALASSFDLTRLGPDFYADPYPHYRALRDHEPIRRMPDGSWLLTRYDDIAGVYRDFKRFSSDKKKEFGAKFGATPLLRAPHDEPDLQRSADAHGRAPGHRGRDQPAAHRRHGAGSRRPSSRRCWTRSTAAARSISSRAFAASIPIGIIGNLLGIPIDQRAHCAAGPSDILGALEPVLTAERAKTGNRAVTEMLAYLKVLVDERRARLRDPDADVLTRLIVGEKDGERLTGNALLHQCIFLLNAGHETTTNLIGNALHALAIGRSRRRG